MHIYIVRMDHPDGTGWNTFVREHVIYLKRLIEPGQTVSVRSAQKHAAAGGISYFQG